MLEVDADKRIRAEQTLSHPYLAEVKIQKNPLKNLKLFRKYLFLNIIISFHLFQYADPTDEPTSPLYDQTFEDYKLNIEEWKGKKIIMI